MFVPRQIQKKAAPLKRLTPAPVSVPVSKPPLLPSPLPGIPPNKTETKKANTKLCANDDIDRMAARETVMALEMLLSDFSMGHVYGDWLRERMREVDGKNDCEAKKNNFPLERRELIRGNSHSSFNLRGLPVPCEAETITSQFHEGTWRMWVGYTRGTFATYLCQQLIHRILIASFSWVSISTTLGESQSLLYPERRI